MIYDVDFFYDFTPGGTIGRFDISDMTLNFSDFDACFNHTVDMNFSDTDFFPGGIGNGSFTGQSELYTIE